jgi:hypothetical protein
LVESAGSQRGLQVYLTPVGAGLVAGVPMRELRGRVVALDALFGPRIGLVHERLLEAPDWNERFWIVDRFLLARLGGAEKPPATWSGRHRACTPPAVRSRSARRPAKSAAAAVT